MSGKMKGYFSSTFFKATTWLKGNSSHYTLYVIGEVQETLWI